MRRTCSHCSGNFDIPEEDLAFYEKISPVFHDKKELIPPPTHCPDCREQRRLSYCNERHFYSTVCGLCKKRILTQYPGYSQTIVYCRECWHGDGWDACAYGQDVDFSRPMFEQIGELRKIVPAQNLLVEGVNVNSDYIHYAGYCKNSYLVMHADFCEDSYYGYGFKHTTNCVDGFYNLTCELCYECIDVHSCYGLRSCQDCMNCNSSAFLRDCIGCKNCFLCVGLRDKEYSFENQQLTKDDYEMRLRAMNSGSFTEYRNHALKLEELCSTHLFKEFHGHNNEISSGDYLQNCKDTHASFDCEDVETGKYLYQVVTGAKDIYDIYQYGLNLRESYECSIAGTEAGQLLLCHSVHSSNYLMYCWDVQNSKNCFACVNCHNKQYCILNKQYTKEEYEMLVPKIIEHMRNTGEYGELFPMSFSPFGYNKTTAQLYYPLTQTEAEEQEIPWDDHESEPPQVEKIIAAAELPDDIKAIPDDLLQWAVQCEVTGKPFRVTKQELAFYRNQAIPLPRRSPEQRHLDRFAKRNPRRFVDRTCNICSKTIRTTFSDDYAKKVACESCYRKTVY
jgi:hypothetical protein